jgi:penicillin V acylase-like amidase (Ntn superfamily)
MAGSHRAHLAAALSVAVAGGLAAPRAAACTGFELARGAGVFVGKCYDWHLSRGLVVINPRGVSKRALALARSDRPARWESSHASVTFNQYGIDLPNGGMNDAGLVVEALWLDETQLPPLDERPTVNELQWIQAQLDRYSSVAEVAAHAQDLRVAAVSGRVHYWACDRSAACAVFEFIGGKLVISRGEGLPAAVLTNHTYARSLAALRKASSPPEGDGSLARFARAALLSKSAKAASPDGAFEILDSVNNRLSVWQTVYDPVALRVEWRTRTQPARKSIVLAAFDATCAGGTKVLDIDDPSEGDVAALFRTDAKEENLALTSQTLRTVEGLSAAAMEAAADYSSRQACAVR